MGPIASGRPHGAQARIRGRLPFRARGLSGRGPEWVVLAASATAIGILAALHLLNNFLGDPRLPLSIDEEGSVGAWFSTVQFFLAFLLCGTVALLVPALRLSWGVLALVLFAFSADDGIQAHHHVEGVADTTVAVLGWQPLAVAVIAVILVRAGRRAGATARCFLLAAIPGLVLAQLCSIGYSEFGVSFAVEEVLGIVEECFEMLVGALIVGAAVSELVPRLALEPPDPAG